VKIGIGLPNTTPGANGRLIVEWARRADPGAFGTVAVLDRLVYDSIEPFVALAAAAAVTERVRLATMIAIGPLRSPAMLAKLAESVRLLAGESRSASESGSPRESDTFGKNDSANENNSAGKDDSAGVTRGASGSCGATGRGPGTRGRFTLGLGIGARRDDYEVAEVDHRTRGARLSEQLALLRTEHAELELLVGGSSGPAFARMARYADGYAHGGGPPRAFASAATRARAAWSDLGRPGQPKLWGQGYFALGDPERGTDYLRDYYAFTGPFAEKIAAGNLTSARAIKDFVRGYAAEGCDELILLPTVSDLDELDRLAEVLG
jgi:Luciferase-like monooxygenase